MAAPTISLTLVNLRRRLARRFDDNENGTATGGSASGGSSSGGTLTAAANLIRYPSSPSALLGAELTHIDSSNTIQSRFIQSHSVSSNVVTLEVWGSWTAPVNNDTYEIHRLSNHGFTKAQYEDAINAAIDSVADGYFTDTDTVLFGIEKNGPSLIGYPRDEYPVPASLNYLYRLHYLAVPPGATNPIGNMDVYRTFGQTTGSTRLAQGFKVGTTGFYEWFSVSGRKVGAPTDNLVLTIRTDSSGVASGTLVTDGTSTNYDGSTLETRNRNIPFRFNPPVYLTAGTQYHWSVTRSGATSDTNYYQLCEDTGNSYGDGVAQTYAGSYVAVSGSDFCFSAFPASTKWIELAPRKGWEYRRIGTDILYIPGDYWDGTPIRISGSTAIAEVSSETAAIPIRPEWVEAYAVSYLLASKTAQSYGPNYATASGMWANRTLAQPRPIRGIPPNAVKVEA